jgi:thymidylate synthase ThyX
MSIWVIALNKEAPPTRVGDPHAQYEIRVYSDAMLELIEPIVPVAVQAFNGPTHVRERPRSQNDRCERMSASAKKPLFSHRKRAAHPQILV